MSEEIKELDMNKYLVLKWEDINQLPYYTKEFVNNLNLMIKAKRALNGKPHNQYLVLNLDDEIDLDYLTEEIESVKCIPDQLKCLTSDWENIRETFKAKDIAVALVNAILKAKGD